MKKYLEKHKKLILDAEKYIWNNPETGFKEYKTQAYLAEKMQELGYSLTFAEETTGFYTEVDTGRPGPTLMLIAELDALVVEGHPAADPVTNAAHACGHHAQCATLLGVAAALKEPGILDGLSGKIRLTYVPAEEITEALEFDGVVRHLSGKQAFIIRGHFEGVDLAINFHALAKEPGTMLLCKGNNGFMIKHVTFTGRSAHAGAAPHKGINALYAANLALNAMNALRETFKKKDDIRVHPIITSGGGAVNVIPNKVVMKNQLRASSTEALLRENPKLNRAVAGAALAMGANATISDRPGYMPLYNDKGLSAAVADAAKACLGEENLKDTQIWSTGSTDVGDLSTLMPTVCAYVGGVKGGDHTVNYEVVDAEALCVGGAEVMLKAAQLLLENDASRAKEIIENFQPIYASKEEYCAAMDALTAEYDAITYDDDHAAGVRF